MYSDTWLPDLLDSAKWLSSLFSILLNWNKDNSVKYCVHCAAKNYVNVAKEKHVDAAWVLYPFRSKSQKHSCFSLKRASGGTETVSNALTSIPSAKSKFLEYKIKCKSWSKYTLLIGP